jgi:hypothetical protein
MNGGSRNIELKMKGNSGSNGGHGGHGTHFSLSEGKQVSLDWLWKSGGRIMIDGGVQRAAPTRQFGTKMLLDSWISDSRRWAR